MLSIVQNREHELKRLKNVNLLIKNAKNNTFFTFYNFLSGKHPYFIIIRVIP